MNNDPIFKNIFGNDWEAMPKVFHKHYANRPYCNDIHTAHGTMNIEMAWFMKPFAPLLALMGTLVAKAGQNIKTEVNFISQENSNVFIFDRRIYFDDAKPLIFYSKLQPFKGNEVIEWTKSGIGWHCCFTFENGMVFLRHKSYRIKMFGKAIKIPIEIFMGEGFAFEKAISDDEFEMMMEIRHKIFGKIYGYSGRFNV